MADRDLAPHRRFDRALGGAFGVGGDGDIDLVDDRCDLGLRFPEGLSGFTGDQRCEFFFLLPHDVGEAAQCFHSVGDRMARPVREGRSRGRNFGRRISDRA
jgi:hypothetical protein